MPDYMIEAEVAGGFGDNAVLDHSTRPVTVTTLHYSFDGWLGGELLAGWPIWIASDRFVQTVTDAGLTGFTTAGAEIDLSEEGKDMLGEDFALPHFSWFKLTGTRGSDDFALFENHLVVNDRTLQVITPMLGQDFIVTELD